MIRELRTEDKAIFIKMVKDFYNSEAVLHSIPLENIYNTYEEIISGSQYAKAYIIEEESEIAGYGLISLTFSNEAGGFVLWIEELYILEKYRGYGLGGKFLDFIEKEYSSRVKRFRLELSESNIAAKSLYLKKGYESLDYTQMVHDI